MLTETETTDPQSIDKALINKLALSVLRRKFADVFLHSIELALMAKNDQIRIDGKVATMENIEEALNCLFDDTDTLPLEQFVINRKRRREGWIYSFTLDLDVLGELLESAKDRNE